MLPWCLGLACLLCFVLPCYDGVNVLGFCLYYSFFVMLQLCMDFSVFGWIWTKNPGSHLR